MGKEDSDWYVAFISIVFGVFISAWATQVAVTLAPMPGAANSIKDIEIVILRGGLLFLILICLWWWYAHFFFKVSPPKRFWMYFFDFLSLGIFAVAFCTWRNETCYNYAVSLGAIAVVLRLGHAYYKTTERHSRITIRIAFAPLLPFIIYLMYIGLLSEHLSFSQR